MLGNLCFTTINNFLFVLRLMLSTEPTPMELEQDALSGAANESRC